MLTLLCAGLGMGIAAAIGDGDAGQLWRVTGAALALAPAVWVLGGIATALVGLAPRAAAGAWVALTACVTLWFVGPLLEPPDWVLDLSPYHHVPAAPAVDVTAGPLLALTAVAVALTAVGLAGIRRRDLT